jgi:hypothetical protein
MKHVSAIANDFTTPTMLIDSSNIITTYTENTLEVSNSNNIKPSNKKTKV